MRSADGHWLMDADLQSRTLRLREQTGGQVRSYAMPPVAAVARGSVLVQPWTARENRARTSWVMAFAGCLELWEISLDPDAAPIYDGLVHDYRSGEALARPGYLGVRRTLLDEPLDDWVLPANSPYAMGRARWGDGRVQLINLDIRRRMASFPDAARAAAALPKSPQPETD